MPNFTFAHTQPIIVPFVQSANPVPPVPLNTSGGQVGNELTAPVSPSTTPVGVGSSTVATAGSSLLGYVESVVLAPTQHIIGAIILLIVAIWMWKHVVKGLI